MTLYLYPMCVISDSILWSVIRSDGQELWGQLLHTGTDPLPLANRALPTADIVLCASDDSRVIAAQEAGFK